LRKFNTSLYGYNKLEVHNFVNEVTSEYESMLTKLKRQDEDIANLKNELERYKNMENTLNRAIMVAEDASNQIKKVARDEARGVIDDAKRNASRIVNDALLKAEKASDDADRLKRNINLLKRRLKSIIEGQLEIIEEMDKIEFERNDY